MTSQGKDIITPRRAMMAIGALAVVFVAYGWLVSALLKSDRGIFGDMYGALNAFLSGLAMFGMVAAILMQREELQLQREELTETRRELAKSAEAQATSAQILRDTLYAQSFGVVIGVLQAETTRRSRRLVLDRYADQNFAEPHSLPEEAREAAETVAHTYDSVGRMVQHGLIPFDHIGRPSADSLKRCWRIVGPMVQAYRTSRGAPELWAGFEGLARRAEMDGTLASQGAA